MAEPSPDAVPRLWREGPPERPEARAVASRRRAIFALQAAIMALAGTIVGMLYWIRPIPEPRLVPLWVAGAQARAIPPVPMAEADLATIDRRGYFAPGEPAAPSQGRAQLSRALEGLKALGAGRPVVLYVCAPAWSGIADGEPARPGGPGPVRVSVLPADADPRDPRSWMPLRQVLEALRDAPAPRKLLILDVMRPLADPRLGALVDDVAARVGAELQAVPDPRRLALCACAPGQVPLDSEDLGRSVFSFYLEEGLRGWADRDGAGGLPDGVITARELAGYVASRVDRWAARDRGARQTPVLLGPGALDFPLVVLPDGSPRPHLQAPEPRAYPAWLLAGWKQRDLWWDDGSYRLAPRVFLRLEAALLRAEREWRGGGEAARIQKDLAALRAELGRHLEQLRKLPRPEPRSLGLAVALGRTPEAAVAAELKDLLAKRDELAKSAPPEEARAGEAKLVEGFLARTKGRTDFDLSWAVVAEAAAVPVPDPETIRFLDGLLRPRQRDPLFVETLTLRRLAEWAASDPGRWPARAAHLALEVVRRAHLAEGRARPLPWVRPLLDEAAQERHDAEVLLWERGYAPLDEATRLLEQAASRYELILSIEEVVDGAWRAVDEATVVLPATVSVLEAAPQMEGVWEAAVQEARAVFEALAPPGAGASGDGRTAAADLRRRADALGRRAERLRHLLDEFRSFASERRTQLLAQAGEPEAVGSIVGEIEALLASPLPRADERASLWKAARGLSRRLLDATMAPDRQPEDPIEPASDLEEDPEGPWRRLFRDAARRARWSIDLLALGGLDPAELKLLEDALGRASGSEEATPWYVLARDLRRAWLERLPGMIEGKMAAPEDLAGADRLSRIAPPWSALPALDDPETNPTARLRARAEAELWARLADRSDYEARDLGGTALLAAAARGFRSLAPPPRRASVRFVGLPEVPELSLERPSASAVLRLQADATEAPAVEVLTADAEWLRIRTGPADGLSWPLHVEWRPDGGRSGTPPPRGFLVRARVEGRSFHARVPVTLPASPEPWQVLLSQDPEAPSAPQDDLRLRPVKGRQPFHLYVLNPTAEARKVGVELRAGDSPVPGGSATLVVPPGRAEKVAFADAPAPGPMPPTGAAPGPEPELPELKGPLVIRLLDADRGNAFLLTRRVRVGIASPSEYVRVVDARFEPPGPQTGGKNRLSVTLRASSALAGPPCTAELVLPRDRIPGLIAAEAGTFRGELPAGGEPLTLLAEEIRLSELGEEDGAFYLAIDDVPRALVFRASFARRGGATTPRLDFAPDLRLRASRSARTGAPYQVVAEVDNPPPGAQLEVSLGRDELGGFRPEHTTVSEARRRRVGFGLRDGALAFEAAVEDWVVPIPTAGVEGRRRLQARLLKADGGEIKRASQPLILDDRAPRGVRIVGVPRQARRGSALTAQAVGTPGESGIKQVVFFLGRPVDGRPPPNTPTIEARPTDDARTSWAAIVPLPADKTGPVDLSVQFVSGVDLSTFDTASVELLETVPVASGRIRGRVLEGDRPQPGLEVLLRDEKGGLLGRTKTDSRGQFGFEPVAPGTYRVFASKPASPSKREAAVEVTAGETAPVELSLLR